MTILDLFNEYEKSLPKRIKYLCLYDRLGRITMSKYIDYQPLHIDEIDYNKCKWLYNEVCCCDKSPYVADYPNSNMCKSKKDCDFFEKEDGE